MVILTRLEESIKARLCFKFQINHSIHLSFPIHSLHKQFFTLISESLWTSSSSVFVKSFLKFSGYLNLENLCYSFFSSLLPLPKRIRQGLTSWILFVSLFSLFQKNKGLTAWILLCLPSPLSKNSKWHSLRILLILLFPIIKRFQRTNRLRDLLFPLHKVSMD